jgi:biotin-(acetyl-CoA carboxylase) ligase
LTVQPSPVIRLGDVSSTMDVARERLARGDTAPFWIVAERQSGGRGRHGRQWSSPPGNLYATLALSEPCRPEIAPQLGFVAGVALHDAVASVTGLAPPRLAIKWPNDLLLDGAKLAGLLLEGSTQGGRFHVLIGFGVNIVSAPEGTPYPATSLLECMRGVSRDPSPAPSPARGEGDFGACPLPESSGQAQISTDKHECPRPPLPLRERVRVRGRADDRHEPDTLNITSDALLQTLTQTWTEAEALWRRGFGGVRERWLSRAALMGERISVRLPAGERHGVMRGIDDSGRLLLDAPDGRVTVDAGDVFPL